jgi:hypothetical protein
MKSFEVVLMKRSQLATIVDAILCAPQAKKGGNVTLRGDFAEKALILDDLKALWSQLGVTENIDVPFLSALPSFVSRQLLRHARIINVEAGTMVPASEGGIFIVTNGRIDLFTSITALHQTPDKVLIAN